MMKHKYFLTLLKSIVLEKKNRPFEQKRAIVIPLLEKVINGEKPTITEQIRLVNCIHVSALTGKLEDFYSVSSCVTENDVCKCRAKDNKSICSKCYAMQSVSYRSALRLSLLINHIVLNCFDISADAWRTLAIPTINGKARIESHGDVASVCASTNMNRIIESHEHIVFGIWTKNYNFWFIAFEKDGKHKNCTFLVSSDRLNTVCTIPEKYKKYVDKIFTVYSFKEVKEKGIDIHCGFHKCRECGICYNTENKQYYVNEILKSDTKKYLKYIGM